MKGIVLSLLGALPCMAFGGTVVLVNDSPYNLTAVVLAADGTVVGNQEMPPQANKTWSGGWSGGSSSQTPYRVHWYCSDGGNEFSVCTNVSPGAMAVAQTCPGNKTCPLPKDKQPSADSQPEQ